MLNVLGTRHGLSTIADPLIVNENRLRSLSSRGEYGSYGGHGMKAMIVFLVIVEQDQSHRRISSITAIR